jgi:hypothetical protein
MPHCQLKHQNAEVGEPPSRSAGENLFFQWGLSYLFFSKILIFPPPVGLM